MARRCPPAHQGRRIPPGLRAPGAWSWATRPPRSILPRYDFQPRKRAGDPSCCAHGRLDSIDMPGLGGVPRLNNVLAPILMGSELLRASFVDPNTLRLIETREASHSTAALSRPPPLPLPAAARAAVASQVGALIADVPKLLRQILPAPLELGVACYGAVAHPGRRHPINVCCSIAASTPVCHAAPAGCIACCREATVTESVARAHADVQPRPARAYFRAGNTGTGNFARRAWKKSSTLFTPRVSARARAWDFPRGGHRQESRGLPAGHPPPRGGARSSTLLFRPISGVRRPRAP